MANQKEPADDLSMTTNKMSKMYIRKGDTPKELNKSFTGKEGEKKCDIEKTTSSSSMLSCDDPLMNQSRETSAQKWENSNATGSKKIKYNKQSKALNDNSQNRRQFRFTKRIENKDYGPKQNYKGIKDVGRSSDTQDNQQKFGSYKNISPKAGTTRQINAGNKKDVTEKNDNEVNIVNITKTKYNHKRNKRKINKKKQQKEDVIKTERKLPEANTTQFQYLSYADTVRFGVKRETNSTCMPLNYYSKVENVPVSLMEETQTNSSKVGDNTQNNGEEVPDVPPVLQTKCNTKYDSSINLYSESTTKEKFCSNRKEINSNLDHPLLFADFCRRVRNVFTMMTKGRNLLMISGTLTELDDLGDSEMERATITEITDSPEEDEVTSYEDADKSENLGQMKVDELKIILEEPENISQEESNKRPVENSPSECSMDLPINFLRYQHKSEYIILQPNALLNRMKCIPGIWSMVTDINGTMWVMNGKPLECSITVINCNFATLSIIRLPIMPQFDARNMILITCPVGGEVSNIPRTIFTVSSPRVEYNTTGAWYLIFNNPYVLNGTCAGEWFWTPYLQSRVKEVTFYWIPHCTSQFLSEGIDALWVWFPTPPATKDSAIYVIPHTVMQKNPANSGNENSNTEMSFITINPTTRSNLISIPAFPHAQDDANFSQLNSSMDPTTGLIPLSLKKPTVATKKDALK